MAASNPRNRHLFWSRSPDGPAQDDDSHQGPGLLGASILVGFLLIAMYIHSGSLWLPLGFHAAWNFSPVSILGLPMSGNKAEVSLLQTTLRDKPWLTGEAVGMEASVVALGSYIVIGVLFIVF